MVVDTIKAVLNPVELISKYLNPLSEDFIFTKLFDTVSNLFNVFDENSEEFIFTDMFSWLDPFSDDFFLKGLLNVLNPFSEDFFLKQLFSWINPNGDEFFLTKLFSWINPFSDDFFGYKIIDLFSELFKFLFVPSEESINSLVNSVKDHFGFIDTINNTIAVVQDMFSNTAELPKITITLKDNKWYSGEITVIDLSWYDPYKEYGDLIISAFIYVFFLWRIFVNLPNIISGAGGGVDNISIASSDIEAYHRFGFGRRSSLTKKQ